MTENRPLNERPEARPVTVPDLNMSDEPPAKPAKQKMGCCGWILIVPMAIVGIVIVWSVVSGIAESINSSRSSSSPSSSSQSSPQQSSTPADPIEQARVVLGGAYSYEQVQSVTDSALSAAGLVLNDDNRNRAWSSAIAVTENSNVSPMAVLECAPGLISAAGNLSLPDAIGFCYTEISLR